MMQTTKRELLLGGAAATLAAASFVGTASADDVVFAPGGEQWRRYEVTTRLRLPASAQPVQAWVPLQSFSNDIWVRALDESWSAPNAQISIATVNGARMLHLSWPAGVDAHADVATRFESRDRSMPSASAAPTLSAEERRFYTAGSRFVPTGGIVRQTVRPIVAGVDGDLERSRAIYEWMVEHTFRDGAVRGCGTGDVEAMLRSGRLGGKCADLNALFVALSRSAGIPSREIYGVRVGPSRFGYNSLGPRTPTITRSQHCRAESFIDGLGWVAMDPADVRKVMLEEVQGGLQLDDARVVPVRRALFGAAEGNWLPYNTARDVVLPGSAGDPVPFLMYAQVEIGGVRADCLDPDSISCVIEARELV